MKFLILISLTLFAVSAKCEISVENQEIIRKWLPVYWLHSEEVFMPTNFDHYISQMELRDEQENVVDANPTAQTLIVGPESSNLHLNTRQNIECVHCYDDAFYGLPVDKLKPFAIAKEWHDECNTIDVKFNTWYAYNYGKDVCLSLDPQGFCLGVRVTLGNHFCDGDNSKMRIQNGQPKYLELNAHTFGALYEYDNATQTFYFVSGEGLDISDGIELPVDYPDTVFTVDGHPEIFVSNGSHGNWASEGRHRYLQLVIHLDDFTDRGHMWPYYEQAEIIDYHDSISDDIAALRPDLQFRKFQGRFGNIQEMGCDLVGPIFDVCQVSACGGQPFGGNPTSSSFHEPPICPP